MNSEIEDILKSCLYAPISLILLVAWLIFCVLRLIPMIVHYIRKEETPGMRYVSDLVHYFKYLMEYDYEEK